MSDPFRDDLEAARARVEALERDKAELVAENAALKDALAAARDSAARWDAQQAEADRKRARARAAAEKDREIARLRELTPEQLEARRDRRNWLLGGAGVLGVFAALQVPDCLRHRAHDRWQVEHDARAQLVARWDAMVALPACARTAEEAAWSAAGLDAASTDPRAQPARGWSDVGPLDGRCADAIRLVAIDPAVPHEVRAPLAAWLADAAVADAALGVLADYTGRGDWKDDAYASAPAKVAAFQGAADRVRAELRAVHAQTLPWIAGAIAERQASLPRDGEAWWRLEVGARIDAIDAELHALASSDARLRDPRSGPRAGELAAALVAEVKAAPLAIRRDVRATTGLEALAAGPESAAQVRALSNASFWGAATGERAPFPPEDAEPETEGCGGGGD